MEQLVRFLELSLKSGSGTDKLIRAELEVFLFRALPAMPRLSLETRLSLFHQTIDPMPNREVKYRGLKKFSLRSFSS
ncbi:hypothetical protein QUF72_15725 [Desulfobacterales bacterium HSG2]|nr:hypothetical protein [Desulfobacterales bacterium HSG2]